MTNVFWSPLPVSNGARGQIEHAVGSEKPSNTHQRAIGIWLYSVAALLVLMVLVGGTTRVTDSGLSIVEWRPVTGIVPPLSQRAWAEEFDKYKSSSEYQLANKGMNLEAFKHIYWWEWVHRLLGRLIGAAFLIPLVLFQLRGWIEPRIKPRLWVIFGLGALQGAIGWWMVASGLVERVDVAQERLAIHLVMACLILTIVIWTARTLMPAPARDAQGIVPNRVAVSAGAILLLLFVQIGLGGLVAGLKAGLIYNTWPFIDGAFIPPWDHLLLLDPPWRNLIDNHLSVQFAHRMMAYLLIGLAALHALDCACLNVCRSSAWAVAALLLLQALLGIATLLTQAPLMLALGHQALAIAVLIAATLHMANLRALSERALRHAMA